jgi:hypothetical protein
VNQLFFPGIQRIATSVQRGHTTRDVKPLMCTEGCFWVYTLGYIDSRHYQKKVVGLERGPLSLVSTTEELLDRKVTAPV